ncbi:NADH dehydrogenase [bacterium]|nr:NADH dehydrogenase [bacterium]
MVWLPVLIGIPFLTGCLGFILPQRIRRIHEALALAGSLFYFGVTVYLFAHHDLTVIWRSDVLLKLDMLSRFVLLASGLFGVLIVLFSYRFIEHNSHRKLYYASIQWTLGGTAGVLLSNHLLLFLFFWGILGITLYWLVLTGGDRASRAAQKTLIMIGGSDALILLGIMVLYGMTKTFFMDRISVPVDSVRSMTVFICLAVGAFAKAGAMPVHTWIPDVAESAPVPVTAFLPAALDKLLGIYLLARICLSLLVMTWPAQFILMVVGAVTIIAAVMMALVQHDFRKLLAYHAVSQVGYMVLGIGTGHPLGIAGGLFHMLNHSIYKACLFLSGGAVQYRTGETDLRNLGGLAKWMPVTFSCFLIAALSISGIPPFNGFASKWMIYQGILVSGHGHGSLWLIWLIAAMFGSGLTLASFMKLSHSIFLGVPPEAIRTRGIREVGVTMTLPLVTLAALCVFFGIAAFAGPVRWFIAPVLPSFSFAGNWVPDTATLLLFVGFLIGIVIYLFGKIQHIREADPFTGGEKTRTENRITGTGFYDTIRQLPVMRHMYHWAEEKRFDVYEQMDLWAHRVAGLLRQAHTGLLTMYIFWVLAGLIALLLIFMLKM